MNKIFALLGITAGVIFMIILPPAEESKFFKEKRGKLKQCIELVAEVNHNLCLEKNYRDVIIEMSEEE